MKISIFHYHFLPGGVTSVVQQAIRALMETQTADLEFTVISGKLQNTDQLQREFADIPLHIRHVPELDYLDAAADEHHYSSLRRELHALRGGIWWIHNYHLGKNPSFTRALMTTLQEHKDQRVLLHVHDFPEESRFTLLHRLIQGCGMNVYPVFPHLRYIAINSRDYQNLQHIGIPSSHLFLLQPPVLPAELRPSAPIPELRQRLRQFARKFPGFKSSAPTWLYPVRSIRRKNILEAGLIARCHPFNLIVSLPGVSSTEKAYSSIITKAFRSGKIPGVWGTGTAQNAPSLDDLVTISDGIISSSVQEGFGYQFIHSLLWNKPLLARRIPVLGDIVPYMDQHPHFLYSRFFVLVDTGARKELFGAYRRNITNLKKIIPSLITEKALQELENLHEVWDFSLLSVKEQVKLLHRSSPGLIRSLNSHIFQIPVLQDTPAPFPEDHFGTSAFAQKFMHIIQDTAQQKGGDTMLSLQGMLDMFTELSHFRLLSM